MSVYPLLYYCTVAGMAIANFIRSPKFHIYFQQWHSYFEEFYQDFCNYDNNIKKHLSSSVVDFSRIDHMAKLLVRLCLAIYVGFSTWLFFILRKCLLNLHGNCDRLDMEQAWVYALYGPFSMLYVGLDQVRLAIMMQAIFEAFRQLKEALESHLDLKDETVFRNVSHYPAPKTIIQLVYHLRKLIWLISSAVGPTQVIFLGFFFSGTITTWMMVLYFIKGEMSLFLVVTIMQMWLLQLLVLLAFAKIAEKMLNGENDVLSLISKMNLPSLEMKVEVIKSRNLQLSCYYSPQINGLANFSLSFVFTEGDFHKRSYIETVSF